MSEGNGDRRTAASALVTLRTRVDVHFDQAMERSPGAMQCRAGCDMCCHARLSVFAVEAASIADALATISKTQPDLRARIRRQADDPERQDVCPLLVDGSCSVYDDRPLICRSHGLPIAVAEDDGSTTVDWCPLNYRTGTPPSASTLRLDAVNQPLAVMALLYDENGDRIDLATLARAD
jgi:Fe-S-cluster containining protein